MHVSQVQDIRRNNEFVFPFMRSSYQSMPKLSLTAAFFSFYPPPPSKWKRWPWDVNTVVDVKFLYSEITQRNLADPHCTRSNNQPDLGICKVSGEPWSVGWPADVMWKIPHYSIICCCLLNCEELHELDFSCFHCQSPFGTWKCYFPIDTCIFSFCMHPMIIHKQHM